MAERGAAGLILAEDFALCETGALYGPGLVAHGMELGRLVFVRAPDAPALFQAMEEALRSGAPAVVVGEAWNLKAYDLAVSRRLLLAARAGATPALLIQASAYGAASKTLQRRRDALRNRRRAERARGFGGQAGAPFPGRPPSPRGSSRRA